MFCKLVLGLAVNVAARGMRRSIVYANVVSTRLIHIGSRTVRERRWSVSEGFAVGVCLVAVGLFHVSRQHLQLSPSVAPVCSDPY